LCGMYVNIRATKTVYEWALVDSVRYRNSLAIHQCSRGDQLPRGRTASADKASMSALMLFAARIWEYVE